MQEIAIDKINQLGKKLKVSHPSKPKLESKSSLKDLQKRIIQPQ